MAEPARRHPRLPAQRLRIRGDAPRGGRRRARCGDRQHLRRHRRGGAPGAADDPQAAPPASRTGASSSPAAPRSSTPQTFADMPEVDRVLGNAEKLDRAHLAGDGEPVVVADIMTVRGRRRRICSTASRAGRAPSSRSSRAATTAAPSASSRSRAGRTAACRSRWWSTRVRQLVANGYREIVLTGVDICSWGADLPGRPTLGGAGARGPRGRAGAAAPAALLARSGGDRRRAVRGCWRRSRG